MGPRTAQGHDDVLLVTRTAVSWLQDNPDVPNPDFPYSYYAAEVVA